MTKKKEITPEVIERFRTAQTLESLSNLRAANLFPIVDLIFANDLIVFFTSPHNENYFAMTSHMADHLNFSKTVRRQVASSDYSLPVLQGVSRKKHVLEILVHTVPHIVIASESMVKNAIGPGYQPPRKATLGYAPEDPSP